MKPDLIVIAHAGAARLLRRDPATAALEALDEVHRPTSVLERVRVVPDVGRPLDPRRRRLREFATVLARRVEDEMASGRFDRVALFAACPFLGELMRQLARQTKQALRAVIDADISELAWDDTTRRIERDLQAADAEEAARRHRAAA